MRIRPYRQEDRDILKEITATCFGRDTSIDYTIEQVLGGVTGKEWDWHKKRHIDRDIAANPPGIFVAEVDAGLVGFITTRVDEQASTGYIPNMAVLPDRQGEGIGRALIEAALHYFRQQAIRLVRIETLDTNPVGQHLYPSCGFKEAARQIHYAMSLENDGTTNSSE